MDCERKSVVQYIYIQGSVELISPLQEALIYYFCILVLKKKVEAYEEVQLREPET
jgi:hypothetical protein